MRKRDIQKILAAAEEQIAEGERELREPNGEPEVQHLNSTRINGRLDPLRERRKLLKKALEGRVRFTGKCEECGEPIPMVRLETYPETNRCTPCQTVA